MGTVVQSRSKAISETEKQVRDKLIEAGIPVHKGRSAIQCGYEAGRNNFPILTPDILISKTKVCVEIDPAYTHATEQAKDRTRNELLAEAGWQVVRLRLGGLDPIGDHDVVAESETVTNAAITALVAAISDAAAGRPGQVRKIRKKAPGAPRKKSRLGGIVPHKYYENAFYVSWTLDSGKVLRLVAMDSARYLAIEERGWGVPRFIRALDLHKVPRAERRAVLEPLLESMSELDFVPASTFPWGDQLFVGEHAESVNLPSKFYPGASPWSMTANISGMESHTDVALCSGNTILAELHPQAAASGWRIDGVTQQTGRHGPYQQMQIRRIDEHASEESE